MAVTEYFVAPGGTDDEVGDRGLVVGNPWATPEFALQTGIYNIGQGAGGDRLIFAAGNYVLTANLGGLQYFTSFAMTNIKSFYYQGNSSGDTTLDGDGTYSIHNNSRRFTGFTDLELTNTGANNILQFDHSCGVVRCKLHNTSAYWVESGQNPTVQDCELFNCSGVFGLNLDYASIAIGNEFHDTTNRPGRFINLTGVGSNVSNNTFKIATTGYSGYAIFSSAKGSTFANNSIYALAATGVGIFDGEYSNTITGNLVEGFSGSGGFGIRFSFSFRFEVRASNNAVYNCTTPYEYYTDGYQMVYVDDNETLGASPFANASGGDFTPVDVGNVWGGGWPTVGGSAPDKGAVQRLAGGGNGGGGGLRLVGAGGLIG